MFSLMDYHYEVDWENDVWFSLDGGYFNKKFLGEWLKSKVKLFVI